MNKHKNYIEVEFNRYISIKENPYYVFNTTELFKQPFLVSCTNYPEKMGEFRPEEKINIWIEGVDKLDHYLVLNKIEWQN